MKRPHQEPEWLMLGQTLSMTQVEVAEKSGCVQKTIFKWEKRHGIKRTDPRLSSRKWLHEHYIEKELSTYKIADILDCSAGAVRQRLHSFDIEIRDNYTDTRLLDKTWLRDHYVDKEMSTYEIARILDCTPNTVSNKLNSFSIKTRYTDMDERLSDADWLKEQYVDKQMSSCEIANILDCTPGAIIARLNSFGIETRSSSNYKVYCDVLNQKVDSRVERTFARGLDEAELLDQVEYHPESTDNWQPDFQVGSWLVECKHGDITAVMGGKPARQAPAMEACDEPILVYGLESDGDDLPHDMFIEHVPGEVPDLSALCD